MQWTDKYGRLHYCLLPPLSGIWCPLTRVCLSLNFVQFSHLVSGLGWADWARLDWAAQISVCHFYQGRSLRPPPNLRPSFDTREDIFNKRLSSPQPRPRFIHHCVFQESSDCSIVKCDYYDTDTAAPVSIFDPMLSSLPLSSISSLGIRAVNEPSQSCTVPRGGPCYSSENGGGVSGHTENFAKVC